jgi:hypothetical protein
VGRREIRGISLGTGKSGVVLRTVQYPYLPYLGTVSTVQYCTVSLGEKRKIVIARDNYFPPSSLSLLVMALDGQSPGLGDEVFRNCDVFARLLSVPGFLDSSKRRFRCRRIACYKLAAGNNPMLPRKVLPCIHSNHASLKILEEPPCAVDVFREEI